MGPLSSSGAGLVGLDRLAGSVTLATLLALAAAFHFVQHVHFIRWYVGRQSGFARNLAYAYWAVVLAAGSTLLVVLPSLLWGRHEGATLPETWAAVRLQPVPAGLLAFALAHALPPVINRLRPTDRLASISRAVQRRAFERMLWETGVERIPMMYTLRNGQVYVGFTVDLPEPGDPDPYLRILPLRSGYREENTFKTRFRVDYLALLEPFFGDRPFRMEEARGTWLAEDPALLAECVEAGSYAPALRQFYVLLAVEEIVTAHPYRASVYGVFQREQALDGGD